MTAAPAVAAAARLLPVPVPAPVAAAALTTFELADASVSPRHAYVAGRRVRIARLPRTPRWRAGDRVSSGQRIGGIGATGNARAIGCHLHFEIHGAGVPIDPAPELHDWS